MKIGVFDSGIGGITVLDELRQRLPEVRFVYLGDTANVPYGTKSASQIKKLSTDCAGFLKRRGVDALVVACNTASSHALEEIQAVMGTVPVFGVLEPGVFSGITALSGLCARDDVAPAPPILVLATRATVQSGAYGRRLRELLADRGSVVHEQACPLLVPMIEEGWVDHPLLRATVAEYVLPYKNAENPGIAVLGCTHYPWIRSEFEHALPGWKIIDSACAVADALESWIGSPKLSQIQEIPAPVEWIFTDPDALPAFARICVSGNVERGCFDE